MVIVINALALSYKTPPEDYSLNLEISMISDKENGIQLFYLQKDEKLKKGFSELRSNVANYDKAGKQKKLTFEIPGDVSYLRLDMGTGSSISQITSIQIQGKENTVSIPMEKLIEVEELKDIELKNGGEVLYVNSSSEDPYLIWDTQGWKIEQLVNKEINAEKHILRKVLLGVFDLLILSILVFWKRFLVIPMDIIRNWKLVLRLSKNDFKTKFAGSYLGIIWAFVQPIVTVLVYWFVFEKGLKAGGINTKAGITAPFVLWLVAGLVPWFFFSDALNGGTNALVEYSYLVKKVVFKISILPMVKLLSALFVHVFFIGFTLVLYAGYHYYPDAYTLQIFYYSICMTVLVTGLSYANAAIVVFFRDWTQVINIILQVGVWITPIMWNIDGMDLSPILITIFKLNPMYYIVNGYREALIGKTWFWENPTLTIYFWIFTILIFAIGTGIFKRLKVHFADVL